MSMQDPIADLFSRINNAQARGKASVIVPSSNKKISLVSLLKDKGYVEFLTEDPLFCKETKLTQVFSKPVVLCRRNCLHETNMKSMEWLTKIGTTPRR